MTLEHCRRCGSDLFSPATSCPYCGEPLRSSKESLRNGFEWKSRAHIFGIPLVHVAFGRDGQGRMRVAKGVVAVGQFAVGAITVGQCGIGFLFGLGQCVTGVLAVGQVAVGLVAGIGQIAVGILAIGQCVAGLYGMGQVGWARYLWSPNRTDMEAVALFHTLYLKITQLLGLQ